MKNEDFEKLTNSIQEKLGKENSSLIADDLATLMTNNNSMNSELEKRNSQIEQLKTDKENLQNVNMNLLQQIPMGDDNISHKDEPKDEPKKFSFKSCFDEKGNFIK